MAYDPGGDGGDPFPDDAPPPPPPPGYAAGPAREPSPVRPKPLDLELFYEKDFLFDRDPNKGRRAPPLGEGSFGVAYKGMLRRVTPVVIKVLKEGPGANRQSLVKALVKEVESWQRFAHDNVLRFHGYCIEHLALVSDFADGGDLQGVLKDLKESGRPDAFPMPGFKKCLLQVAQGMQYLHSMNILHCDLKPANVMIRNGAYMIADFGFSTLRDFAGTSTAGTPAYMPPEALRVPPASRGKHADVYSFGVIAYEVVCGEVPNVDLVLRFAAMRRSGTPLRRPYETAGDDQTWHMIQICTDVDPLDRPFFDELLADLTDTGVSEAGGIGPPRGAPPPGDASNRILLQVANRNYGPPGHEKNLPMALESVALLQTVLVLFYGFSGKPLTDHSAHAIRTAARPALSSLRSATGTSIVHLVGHGGDRQGRFVFEGVPSAGTESEVPAEDSTVDLERDIISQIPTDHRGLVVVLLDCCRGSMGTEDRPFDVDRNNVVVGFAARHGEKAYGCLYTFVLAEELWKRFDRQDKSFTWRELLDDVRDRIVEGTATARGLAQGTESANAPLVQKPRHMNLGHGQVDLGLEAHKLRPDPKSSYAIEGVVQGLAGAFQKRSSELYNQDALQQTYPLAAYVEDLFTSQYKLEMTFEDGTTWHGDRSQWTAVDLILELCRTSELYGDKEVVQARLLFSPHQRAYNTSGLFLHQPHQMVFAFMKGAVVSCYNVAPMMVVGSESQPVFLLEGSMTDVSIAAMTYDPGRDGGDLDLPDAPPFLAPPGGVGSSVRETSPFRPKPADLLISYRDEIELDRDPDTSEPVKLGSGAFGVVYKGKLRRDTPVAIKRLQRSGPHWRLLEEMAKEVELWQLLRDDNVLGVHGYCADPFAVVYEFADGGDLKGMLDRVNDAHAFPWKGGIDCLLQVAQGMRYLHSKNVLHCDLKPANILICRGQFKITDFGLSTLRDLAGTSTAGTFGYTPPEALRSPPAPRDKPGDVYSFGMIAYEVSFFRIWFEA
ncbi:kinase-like domain-containing protein [Hyaloraphidium curvatum]|nr:kinase-like domain-containing protein [Hyaloraphidium curvatum]